MGTQPWTGMLMKDGDMSGPLLSNPLEIFRRGGSIQASMVGPGTPVGTLGLEWTPQLATPDSNTIWTHYSDCDFDITAIGSKGWIENGGRYRWIRVKWTPAGGSSGLLTVAYSLGELNVRLS